MNTATRLTPGQRRGLIVGFLEKDGPRTVTEILLGAPVTRYTVKNDLHILSLAGFVEQVEDSRPPLWRAVAPPK